MLRSVQLLIVIRGGRDDFSIGSVAGVEFGILADQTRARGIIWWTGWLGTRTKTSSGRFPDIYAGLPWRYPDHALKPIYAGYSFDRALESSGG